MLNENGSTGNKAQINKPVVREILASWLRDLLFVRVTPLIGEMVATVQERVLDESLLPLFVEDLSSSVCLVPVLPFDETNGIVVTDSFVVDVIAKIIKAN